MRVAELRELVEGTVAVRRLYSRHLLLIQKLLVLVGQVSVGFSLDLNVHWPRRESLSWLERYSFVVRLLIRLSRQRLCSELTPLESLVLHILSYFKFESFKSQIKYNLLIAKNYEDRETRTPNLLIWSQTRCRCVIAPLLVSGQL